MATARSVWIGMDWVYPMPGFQWIMMFSFLKPFSNIVVISCLVLPGNGTHPICSGLGVDGKNPRFGDSRGPHLKTSWGFLRFVPLL